ncbi:hypothetical protein LEMLEM_LOCUS11209, partial [Lemmus lemmus]
MANSYWFSIHIRSQQVLHSFCILNAKKNKETFVHQNLYLVHRIPEHGKINQLLSKPG